MMKLVSIEADRFGELGLLIAMASHSVPLRGGMTETFLSVPDFDVKTNSKLRTNSLDFSCLGKNCYADMGCFIGCLSGMG